MGRPIYSDREIVDAVREAAAGGALGKKAYEESRRAGTRGPSAGTVVYRYGSWSGALAAAGVSPARRGRVTDEELCAALRLAHDAGVYTVSGFRRLLGRPSAVTVRKRFGSWRKAWAAAGLPDPVELERAARQREKERKEGALEPARARLALVAKERTFLVPADASRLGVTAPQLKRLAREAGMRVVPGRVGDALLRVAEAGFPGHRARPFALSLARGATLAGVSRESGLSRERVRQLVMKYAASLDGPGRPRGGPRTQRHGVSPGAARRSREKRRLAAGVEMLRQLWLAGWSAPRIRDYEEARKKCPDPLPAHGTLIRHHGTWRGLVLKCGFEALRRAGFSGRREKSAANQ